MHCLIAFNCCPYKEGLFQCPPIGLDFFLVNSNRPTGQGRLVKDHLHFSKNNYFLSKVVT